MKKNKKVLLMKLYLLFAFCLEMKINIFFKVKKSKLKKNENMIFSKKESLFMKLYYLIMILVIRSISIY